MHTTELTRYHIKILLYAYHNLIILVIILKLKIETHSRTFSVHFFKHRVWCDKILCKIAKLYFYSNPMQLMRNVDNLIDAYRCI